MKAADGPVTVPEASGVRVLHKTLDILEILKSRESGYMLADLTRSVALPKATVYRILATLERRGYLDRSHENGYRLASKMFDLQRQDSLEQTLSRAAQPVIERLVAAYKENVNLGMVNAGEVRFSAAYRQHPGNKSRAHGRVGARPQTGLCH